MAAQVDRSMAVAAVRFGYGLPESAGSREAIFAGLGQVEAGALAAAGDVSRQRIVEEHRLRRDARGAPADQVEDKHALLRRTVAGWLIADQHAHIAKAVRGRPPMFSRLTEFWANHFTVSTAKGTVRGLAGPFVSEAIEPHLMGRFEHLLLAAELHPAMALYLDLGNSIGPTSPVGKKTGRGLNENLAREILELHTLGVNGGYSQADVTSFAAIMTGWTLDYRNGGMRFMPARAEPGTRRFLGREFGGSAPDRGNFAAALRFLASHAATARFIATKLVRHFIADDPPAAAVAHVEETYRASGGNLPDVYRALWELPEAAAPPGAKARTDFEFVVAALRTAGLTDADFAPAGGGANPRRNSLTAGALAAMQQALWAAPSPAGWPEKADEWLAPAALAQRLNWIPQLVRHVPDRTAAGFLDRVLGPLASEQTRSVVMAASNREEGLALVLASPEFNRR